MIQRIQSLWLFVAALLSVGLFAFDLYKATVMVNGVATVEYLRINDHFPSLLLAIVITLLPLAAIFMYKNPFKTADDDMDKHCGNLGLYSDDTYACNQSE